MNAIIFAGPTLSRDPARKTAGLTFLPPAAHGDVYRAALSTPTAIGLVDGYFESVPSVWHKEILFALSMGIHVYGAASMGALRAAELHSFGMIGVGKVFEAFLSGEIEDDDEVAVVHGPAELDYPPLSEAMVNIRATIDRAVRERVLSEGTSDVILGLAKAIFYKERTWRRVVELAHGIGVPASECDVLRAWLPIGSCDQKKTDAHQMLNEIVTLIASRPPPFRPNFEFYETSDWRQAVHDFEAPLQD